MATFRLQHGDTGRTAAVYLRLTPRTRQRLADAAAAVGISSAAAAEQLLSQALDQLDQKGHCPMSPNSPRGDEQ